MAHAADLPRAIFVYFLSIGSLLPKNLIRYFTTFLPLLIGPIGVHYLIRNILITSKLSHKTIQSSSFLAGLFYLLNLSTLQTFFIPFETFTWFYGALPFLIYFLLLYFKTPKLSNLLRIFFVSFISGTAFYVETLFLVFLLCLAPFCLEKILHNKKFLPNIWQTIIATIAMLLPHLYWLLPVAFFVITNGEIATQNHINTVSSIDTYYRNLEFANPKSLILLQGYLFKYLDLGLNNKFELLLNPWIGHLNSPLISLIGILFSSIFILGLYYSIKTKTTHHKSFLAILFGSAFFLLGGGLLINSTIPLVGELFRSPYTKFSIPLIFSLSYFFAIGVVFILDIFAFLDTRLTYNLTLFTISFLLLIYMSPAFSGNFINKNMRVNIPTEYFDLFSYLNNKPSDLRIANFPQHTFWGWNYYKWGHRGSGFLWYGIKQPILDRAFDVWEKTSQDYYEEISTALYSQNHEEFNKTIDKYNVAYLLLDTSIISPDTKTDLGMNYLDRVIATSDQYELEKTFSNNLLLYKNKNHKTTDFLNLSTNQETNKILEFNFRPNQNWYEKAGLINTNIVIPCDPSTQDCDQKNIAIPSLTESENMIPYKVEYRPNGNSVSLRFTPITPVFFLNNKQTNLDSTPQILTIPLSLEASKLILSLNSQYLSFDLPSETPSITDYYSLTEVYLPSKESFPIALYQGLPTEQYPVINSLINNNPTHCYTKKNNHKIEKIISPRSVTLLGTDLVACLSADLPPVSPSQLLVVSFTYFSPTLTTANVNITNNDFGTENTSQPFEPSTTPKRAQIFTKPSPKNKQVNLILEAEETKTIQEITYKDVFISSHDTLYQSSLKLNPIKQKTLKLENADSNKIQVSLPITKTSYDVIQTPISNALFPEDRNCDRFNQGKTVKLTNKNYITYQSQNAIQCDYLNLRHLPHSLNYIVGIDVKNIKGLPLVSCLENHATKRCDTYERLSDYKGQQYLIQAINNPTEQDGFTLHLFNQSFGKRISENQLKSITVHPFPLNFLKSITLENQKNQFSQSNIVSSSHPYEFFYKLEVKSSGSSEINLLQTKSPHWKAIQIAPEDYSKPPLLIAIKYFFLYPQTFKFSQVDTNYWYNTWSIPSGNNHILIIYLPQYLEFLGLALIILIPLVTLPILLYQKLRDDK